MTPEEVRGRFERFIATLPDAEPRPGQVAMAEAVARAITGERHLIVQAGTGTGKSFAYLVPCVLLGAKVVVATANTAELGMIRGWRQRPSTPMSSSS